MGLFGFGKKKDKKDDDQKAADERDDELEATEDKEAEAEEDESEEAEESDAEAEESDDEESDDDSDEEDEESEDGDDAADEYTDPENPGPWDYDEDDVDPDFDDRYISFGSVFLPIVAGMTIRARRQQNPDGTATINSLNVELGGSNVEIVPMGAPKTMGLWDDMANDLLTADGAKSVEGRFGNEVLLPVNVQSKKVSSRIVGVDGPRWMLRGIFTGPAANVDKESTDRTALEDYFARIIVRRGPEPLAPGDVIPILPPKTADQRRAEAKAAAEAAGKKPDKVKKPKDGPQNYDQQHQVQTTITRGPMFSEVR